VSTLSRGTGARAGLCDLRTLVPVEAAGRADLLALWAGQSARLWACTDPSSYLSALVEDVSAIAGPVMHWTAGRSTASSRG
jgi:hypothetical protein